MWGLEGGSRPWALVIGLVLTSFGWWEAYLPYRTALIVPSLFAYLRDVSTICIHPIFDNWSISSVANRQKGKGLFINDVLIFGGFHFRPPMY